MINVEEMGNIEITEKAREYLANLTNTDIEEIVRVIIGVCEKKEIAPMQGDRQFWVERRAALLAEVSAIERRWNIESRHKV